MKKKVCRYLATDSSPINLDWILLQIRLDILSEGMRECEDVSVPTSFQRGGHMDAKKLESFPAGENPFWHDGISTGAKLSDFVVMDERFDKKYMNLYVMFSGKFGEGLYLVNKDTGERIGIEL